jgi:hypothetical protein
MKNFKSFEQKIGEELAPWELLFHQVSVLDEAARLYLDIKDPNGLLEVSDRMLEASDRLTAIVLGLGIDEEEEEISELKSKRPVGFDTSGRTSSITEIAGDGEEDS